MRAHPMTVMQGGINRLRIKGSPRSDMLYDLVNAYITQAGSISPREGTIRAQTLNSSTVGLAAVNGVFHVFANSSIAVPGGYTCDVLVHPTDQTQVPTKIWFAKPFMGFLYVTCQFGNGDVFDFWLQNNGTWAANTVYKTGNIILPPTPNGLAYLAVRDLAANPVWTSETQIAVNQIIEPNTYTGFAYKAIAVAGASPHTGQVEPAWPTVNSGIVQEFGDFGTTSSSAASSSTSAAAALGSNITNRYGNSQAIAGNTGVSSTISTTAQASTAVTTWTPGTLYAPGAVVRPTTNQGAVINAIPNGDFEAGNFTGTWNTSATGTGSCAISVSSPYAGTYDAQFVIHTDAVSLKQVSYGAVVPGQSVTASAYVNPGSSDVVMQVNLVWYDSTYTLISTSQGAAVRNAGYQPSSNTAVAPANAAYVQVFIVASSSYNRVSYVDNISWNLATPAAASQFLFEAVQAAAGSSGTTEPVWPTIGGNTVVDNGVTWKAIGTSIITWQAIPIMQSGGSAPTFPTTVGVSVKDGNMSWLATSRQITDTNHPNTIPTALAASHIFKGNLDITSFSAAVNPTDWTTVNNAGYLPTGMNNYGDNPVAMLALYRSNLMVFNAGGYQMWQVDPDPANMALLDAQPVGSIWPRAAQSVANDLLFLTEVGVRNLGTVGATANMQIGSLGQPVDPLVKAALQAGTYDPLSLYYPGRGQYWLIFGPQAFVLTVNGAGLKTWARYTFPDIITDWTLSGGILYLRTAGNLVWQLDANTLVDDSNTATATVTITNANPAVVSWTAHGLLNGTEVQFTTTGTLPAPLAPNTPYFVVAAATNTFELALTAGGTPIATTSAGSGVHTGSVIGIPFSGVIQWPYLDLGPLGINKELIGLDLVGDGQVSIQVAFNESDVTTFNDNAGFATSLNVTPAYTIAVADTVPGTPIPFPINAPALSLILTFAPNQKWTWQAANLYLTDQRGGGATGP